MQQYINLCAALVKKSRYDLEHHARKNSNANANLDLFKRAMATGDVEIGDLMSKNKPKKKESTTLPTLPTAARPLIKNSEDFIFEDIGMKYICLKLEVTNI